MAKSLSLGGVLPSALLSFLFAVESLGSLYLFFFLITNSFYFIGDWQVKFFLMWMPFSPSRKGTDLNRNEIPPNSFLSTVSTKLYTDTLLSRFLLSTRGRAHVHLQTCESFFCHPSFPFSCLLFLLSLQKITECDWRKWFGNTKI